MAGTACWEHMRCGVAEQCPAYPDRGFDCWKVEGTLCRGERQKDYDTKVAGCREFCSFYDGVMQGSIKVV